MKVRTDTTTVVNECTHVRGATFLKELALCDRPYNTFLALRHGTRLTVGRLAGGNMDGMTLVRVIPGNGLILYELDLGSLLFLLVVVNAS